MFLFYFFKSIRPGSSAHPPTDNAPPHLPLPLCVHAQTWGQELLGVHGMRISGISLKMINIDYPHRIVVSIWKESHGMDFTTASLALFPLRSPATRAETEDATFSTPYAQSREKLGSCIPNWPPFHIFPPMKAEKGLACTGNSCAICTKTHWGGEIHHHSFF